MKHYIILLSALLLSACAGVAPEGAYFNRGQPESLLHKTAETVSVPLSGIEAAASLEEWIGGKDKPSRAELECGGSIKECDRAEKLLSAHRIPVERKRTDEVAGNNVKLFFEHVNAYACDNRFVSNHNNGNNLNHYAFGCSISANIVQMSSNYQQIIKPQTAGLTSGQVPVKALKKTRSCNQCSTGKNRAK